jgi:hypothetical protein
MSVDRLVVEQQAGADAFRVTSRTHTPHGLIDFGALIVFCAWWLCRTSG